VSQMEPAEFDRALAPFQKWAETYRRYWSHLVVAGAALRRNDAWYSIAFTVKFVDSDEPPAPSGMPIARDDNLAVFRCVVAQDRLASLVEAVRVGILPAGSLPGWSDEIHLRWSQNQAPSVNTHDWSWSSSFSEAVCCSMEMPSGEFAALWAGNHGECSDWLREARRKFDLLGIGAIEKVVGDLELRQYPDWMRSDRGGVIQFRAPIPIRLLAVWQPRGKSRLYAEMAVGSRVPVGTLRLEVQHEDSGFRAQLVLDENMSLDRLCLARKVPPGKVTVRLLLDGYGRLAECEVKMLERWRAWPRALALFNHPDALAQLTKDLAPRPTGALAMEYERGVSLLFGLMGYSAFWWGPNRGLEMPTTDAADVIVVSPDDDEVYVVECTTQQADSKKFRRFIDRTAGVREAIRKKLGRQAILVRPVFALNRPADRTPSSFVKEARVDGCALLTADDAQDLLAMIYRGEPRARIRKRFLDLFPYQRVPEAEVEDVC
jgi:hypothetical protein